MEEKFSKEYDTEEYYYEDDLSSLIYDDDLVELTSEENEYISEILKKSLNEVEKEIEIKKVENSKLDYKVFFNNLINSKQKFSKFYERINFHSLNEKRKISEKILLEVGKEKSSFLKSLSEDVSNLISDNSKEIVEDFFKCFILTLLDRTSLKNLKEYVIYLFELDFPKENKLQTWTDSNFKISRKKEKEKLQMIFKNEIHNEIQEKSQKTLKEKIYKEIKEKFKAQIENEISRNKDGNRNNKIQGRCAEHSLFMNFFSEKYDSQNFQNTNSFKDLKCFIEKYNSKERMQLFENNSNKINKWKKDINLKWFNLEKENRHLSDISITVPWILAENIKYSSKADIYIEVKSTVNQFRLLNQQFFINWLERKCEPKKADKPFQDTINISKNELLGICSNKNYKLYKIYGYDLIVDNKKEVISNDKKENGNYGSGNGDKEIKVKIVDNFFILLLVIFYIISSDNFNLNDEDIKNVKKAFHIK
ncbi:hypothetical protein [Malacoplasma penetrans HF-2]|uniref:Uncharacterized protein n=1 Tax=Malacoplasma penetrans (strain HF-2) TaxID=272633 RepID=Q8EVE1_MALP2|nr:hypothetical protein [Malacoplasma penetrans]BAC44413.1 hypothetical protein [Malacoplasma penetrans HF-2]